MSVSLAKLRQQGFTLYPVDEDGLYIEPIDELTDAQRHWLVDNKPLIRQQLLTERWRWFLTLAAEHGIHPDVVAAEFPAPDDRFDVVGRGDDDRMLRQRMRTLCSNPRVRQRQQDYLAGLWVPVQVANVPVTGQATNDSKNNIHWDDFVACCVSQGVTETELHAMFRQIDIEDLCDEPASKLAKHADTIVAAILRERPVQPLVQSASDDLHQCGRCRHFTANPYTGSAGLGWCNVREGLPMTLPRRVIECSLFKEVGP